MISILQFLPAPPDDSLIYIATYNPAWIAVSILLAIVACYAALEAAIRVEKLSDTTLRLIWTLIGVFMLGIGVWAMHFIGMLAVNLPCRTRYDPVITLLSVIPSILASGVVLGVGWHHGTKRLSPVLGSILLGAGIGAMHYIGMAAMRIDGFVRYDPSLFALSIIVAIALSYLVLRVKNGMVDLKWRGKVLLAAILGSAISGMHYTAMTATYFVRGDVGALPPTLFSTTTLAAVITGTTLFLALAVLTLIVISHSLQQSARFINIVNQAVDAIITVDEEQRILLFNTGAERIFGYTAAEMLGQTLVRLLPERYAEAHHGHIRKFGTESGAVRHMNQRSNLVGRHKDGSEFFAEANISHALEDGKQIFTAYLSDITKRKENENEIRQLNINLERRVLERTSELVSANRELEAFSYSVSHDLRTPLRSIDGFSQALLEDYADKLDDQGRDYLSRVRIGTQRMGHLIDDMIALSHVTRTEMKKETVDLSALAADVLEDLQTSEPERKVDWRIEPGLSASGDKKLLRIVLSNLFGNAWKFTGKTANAKIEFGAASVPDTDNTQGAPGFFVRDNGAGYDMSYADKLFGAFQRLHNFSDFPGTGIGLATVQRIIHRHGGRVRAEGAVGQGATFYFTL